MYYYSAISMENQFNLEKQIDTFLLNFNLARSKSTMDIELTGNTSIHYLTSNCIDIDFKFSISKLIALCEKNVKM